MPYVGIRKTARGFRLTEPNLEKSATVFLEENLLENVLPAQDTPLHQDLLEACYDQQSHKSPTMRQRLWAIMRTENAFWHIQGIITTATLLFAVLFAYTNITGREVSDNLIPISEVPLFGLGALTVCLYSLYTLVKQRRALKRRAAMMLFILYLYYLVYFLIEGINSEYQFITTLAFAGISFSLYLEWSRPSSKNRQETESLLDEDLK